MWGRPATKRSKRNREMAVWTAQRAGGADFRYLGHTSGAAIQVRTEKGESRRKIIVAV